MNVKENFFDWILNVKVMDQDNDTRVENISFENGKHKIEYNDGTFVLGVINESNDLIFIEIISFTSRSIFKYHFLSYGIKANEQYQINFKVEKNNFSRKLLDRLINVSIGTRLKELREIKSINDMKEKKELLTQKDFASFLGISTRTYQSYEKGERFPPSDTLLDFSRFFNESLDYLMFGKKNNVNIYKNYYKIPLLNSDNLHELNYFSDEYTYDNLSFDDSYPVILIHESLFENNNYKYYFCYNVENHDNDNSVRKGDILLVKKDRIPFCPTGLCLIEDPENKNKIILRLLDSNDGVNYTISKDSTKESIKSEIMKMEYMDINIIGIVEDTLEINNS